MMATRSKSQKQETPTASPVPPTHATPSSSQTSPNGEIFYQENDFTKSTRLSRLEEKNTLINLNNRLAAIIERNHQLELENSQLTVQVESAEETLKVTTKTINESIGKENSEIRKQLLDCQNEKSRAILQGQEAKKQLAESNSKLQQSRAEVDKSQKEAKVLKEEAAARKLEIEKQKLENVQLAAQNKSLESDLKKLSDDNAKLKKQCESTTIQNAELTNQLKSKTVELTSKLEMHTQEVTALRSFNQKKIEEIGEKLGKDYETNVQKVIKALRQECEKQIAANKAEQESLFKMKEVDLLKQKDQAAAALKAKANEMQSIEKSLQTTKSRVTLLEKEKDFLSSQVKSLEEMLKSEAEIAAALVKELQAQILTLQEEKVQVINDYQDLMETKVALDNEIATYKSLLEGEEERLNLSMEARRTSRKRHWNAK